MKIPSEILLPFLPQINMDYLKELYPQPPSLTKRRGLLMWMALLKFSLLFSRGGLGWSCLIVLRNKFLTGK